jgi:hypothetical protein
MSEAARTTDAGVRALTVFAIAVTGVFASACLGAITNAVNGWVSPHYFVTVLRWRGVENVWRASVAQGIFEGLLFGVFFSLLFTAGVGLITNTSCRYGFALRHLLGVAAAALAGWVIGGVAAIGLASLSPDFYRRAFVGVPEEFGPMLAYAWVGGSILGLELGGLVSVVLGLVVLRSNWRRLRGAPSRPSEVSERL